jgi:hypothetical protein
MKFIPQWLRFNVKVSFKTENQFKSTESNLSACHFFIPILVKAVIDDSHNEQGNLENAIITVSRKQ